jgi:hypothetical protein
MIMTLTFALASLSAGVAIQRLFLIGRASVLKERKQAFRFHALRDRLQVLYIEQRVSPGVYGPLVWLFNLAIRNAGVFNLTHLLRLARHLEDRVEKPDFLASLKAEAPEVQTLAADFFKTFAQVLISNDTLARIGWNLVACPSLQHLYRACSGIAKLVKPDSVKAVKIARRYENWAEPLANHC